MKLLLSLFLILTTPSLAGASSCLSVLYGLDDALTELAELRITLDRSQATRDLRLLRTALLEDFDSKKADILSKLDTDQNPLTQEIFARLLAQKIEEIQNEQQLQTTAQSLEESLQKDQIEKINPPPINGDRALFNRVSPGAFKMVLYNTINSTEYDVDMMIDQPFDLMLTPMTQSIWKTVADLAVQKLPGQYQINPDPSLFKGYNLPVDNVSYENAIEWIKALNDLSIRGEPQLEQLISGHRKGDIYRLPTYAEWNFVARNRGLNARPPLADEAWSEVNAKGKTHPVARKSPLIFDGNAFYDLYGNVQEWVENFVHPKLSTSESERYLMGGSWKFSDWHLTLLAHWHKGFSSNTTGFRLARTVR